MREKAYAASAPRNTVRIAVMPEISSVLPNHARKGACGLFRIRSKLSRPIFENSALDPVRVPFGEHRDDENEHADDVPPAGVPEPLLGVHQFSSSSDLVRRKAMIEISATMTKMMIV
jgi:hypothetical protein